MPYTISFRSSSKNFNKVNSQRFKTELTLLSLQIMDCLTFMLLYTFITESIRTSVSISFCHTKIYDAITSPAILFLDDEGGEDMENTIAIVPETRTSKRHLQHREYYGNSYQFCQKMMSR